jgi:transmembrane sensor
MMKEIQEENLRFVARHWQPGRFAPQRAWRRFRSENGISRFRPFRSWSPVWGYTLGAALAAIILGVFLWSGHSRTVIPATAAIQAIVLPDGTQATLAPGATLDFRRRGFGRRDRALRQTGQVYYAVARNEQLPFEITAGDGFVRVLGTRFQVLADSAGTSVDVVDGRVLFAAQTHESDGLILTHGMHAALAAGAVQPLLSDAPTANPAAWATHTFYYENTPLQDVLRELSAHFGRSLRTDESERFLTGEFEGEDLQEIISLIEAALDIQIEAE